MCSRAYNVQIIVMLSLTICAVSSRECSDRDFSSATWNFVQCVENNFNSLTTDNYDQIPDSSQICHELDKRKEACLSNLRACSTKHEDLVKASKVLVEQWSQNYELEQKCQQFFSRVEIFSRRNLDKDVKVGSSVNCSPVLNFGNRLLYDRCKSRINDVMTKRMTSHTGNRQKMMAEACRGIDNLVKCGDKILSHCLEPDQVDEINEAILNKMEVHLNRLQRKTGYPSTVCLIFDRKREVFEGPNLDEENLEDQKFDDMEFAEDYEEENIVSTRRKDDDINVTLMDPKERNVNSGRRSFAAISSSSVSMLSNEKLPIFFCTMLFTLFNNYLPIILF